MNLWYWNSDYGYVRREHGHVITLTTHEDGRESMQCMCGARSGRLQQVGALITEHRRHVNLIWSD